MIIKQHSYTSIPTRALALLPSNTMALWCIFFIAFAFVSASKLQAGADIQYILTTQYDPALPDQTIEFDVTVHNLTTSSQPVTLDWTVPEHTRLGGLPAGTAASHNFGTLVSGQSITYQIRLTVLGTDVVQDGDEVVLTLRDLARPPAMVERRVVVRDVPALGLALSTEQGTVAPGGNFTYAVSAANITGGSLPTATLTVDVPEGATFVSADGTFVINGNHVTWDLGTLGPGANERRHVTFQANAGGTPPLGPVEAMLTDGNGHLARASDARVVIDMPPFQYIVTAVQDPAIPGQPLEFDVTVHNLSTSSQSVTLDWTVPEYTALGGLPAGTAASHNFGTMASGQSITYQVRLTVLSTAAVPEGASIILNLFDLVRGASISRTVVTRDVPALGMALSTEQGTVASGGNFTYAVSAANLTGGNLPNATLTVDIPEGATFVSADGTFVVNGNQVTWDLGTLGAGGNERRHVTFQANAGGTPPLGPVNALLTDGNGHLARASDARVVIDMPLFQYIVTAVQDPATPDQTLEFDVTVHNLSTSSQSVILDWTVPQYTALGGLPAGTAASHNFGTLTSGQSITYQIRLTVLSTAAVPEGASITLKLFDLVRSASISRTVVTRDVPALGLALSTAQTSVRLGDNFIYTLAAANLSGGSLPNAALSVVVPEGATFVSADGIFVLNGNVVTWDLGTLGPGANERRHVTFQANAGGNPPLGPVDALLTDGNGHVARASDTRVVIDMPLFSYTLAAVQDPVQQNQTLEFDVTVQNVSTSSQSVILDWTVPQYTRLGGLPAGTAASHNFGTLTSGQSLTYVILLTVLPIASVPDGANITLDMFDLPRGASVSRTVAVNPHILGTPTPTPTPGTPTPTPTATPGGTPGRLANISTRLRVETDDNVLIGGFILTGTQPKRVILRAIGPSLTGVGVPGALANPTLELHDASGTLASNDNWMDAPNRQEIIDSTLAPTNDLESAILMTLPANNSAYTAIVRGVDNTTGVALVEVYDLDLTANSRLANISTRGFVQTSDNVMIGGFIIVQAPARVIVRAIGGSLSIQGRLADPTLELHDVNGTLIASNDNWRSDQQAEIIATGIPPTDDMESAIVRPLNPGNYTAIVKGVNDTTGVALVEIYQLPN